MSQQGDRHATAEDDWWSKLYENEPATGTEAAPTAGGDTLDDRFDSASGVATPPDPPPPHDEIPPQRTRAPWEPPEETPPAEPGWGFTQRFGAPPPIPPSPPEPPAPTPHQEADSGVEQQIAPDEDEPPAPAAHKPTVPDLPAHPRHAAPGPALSEPPPRPQSGHIGDGPPTYDAEPTSLPGAHPDGLDELMADTVLDGARYGAYTLRAASTRGDSARFRGEPRRDALLTARFGTGETSLVLVAVASGARASEGAHLAAADACRWIGGAVGRSHVRLAEDIRAGRRGDLKSGLHRLTDRGYGKLRARAAELGLEPGEYTASLRCLLLSGDPECRNRIFFGVGGGGGLFRLRDGAWQDIEPLVPEPSALKGDAVVGFGSAPSDVPEQTPEGDRLTMDLGITTPPSPYVERPLPPPADPFRFRASVARPGDTLLLCSGGLAEPLRGEPALAKELAERWGPDEPPGLAAFLADTQLRVKGYADDRTAAAVWEA
ncbi:protein phosphatase 2C domain-containing protein [Streptomyces sp. NBC_01465]|uniref:protein phosphatase 2C domain-containing protein n=1 Tax=Streptomyces sp. NBC_01465 TaxID=2903878 RepID=UPI002E2F9F90|nr:protein phosphatase 2C domain-containing protein [Streptomyces sp. NBC_01465]